MPRILKDLLRRAWRPLYAAWSALSGAERRQLHALTLCVVGYLAHYLVFTIAQPFYIEDAGITFAYARHIAEGYGFVTWLGGERVEGFSNPLWTYLIATFYRLWVPVWTSSKLMGAVFGAVTLVLAWAITRRARGGRDDLANVAPSFLLAASTQFVLWNASGLENSLYNVLMAAAIYRVIREGSEGGRPWSAFLLFLLAITRPEGPIYAVVGGASLFVLSFRRERLVLRMLRWLAVFSVPFACYHLWRYQYFAWPWPNTYYAKLSQENRFKPFGWDVFGWKYLKNWTTTYWIAYVSPLFVLAMLGTRRWRAFVGYALIALVAVVVLWNGEAGFLADWGPWEKLQKAWSTLRCSSFYVTTFLCLVFVLGRSGWRALFTVGAFLAASMFWLIYSGGDWMDAFRLGSFVSVPLFLLLGIGISELWGLLPEFRWKLPGGVQLRGLFCALSVLVVALPNAWGSYDFTMDPETSVRDVRRRVTYMTWVQKRLHREEITLLDVDMGAHVYYSGWRIMDVAGLVDVPLGHHQKFPKPFMLEYVFQEGKPDFIHSHGNWSKRTKINNFAEFKRDYFEIPGYPAGKTSLHVGNHIRRDLIAEKKYGGPAARRVDFAGGLVLEGWEIPSDIVPVGGKYYLETWFRTVRRKAGFRVLVFLADGAGHLSVQEIAPGYDWLPPSEWKISDHVVGRHSLQIPASLPVGVYRVGIVLLDSESGEVLRVTPEAIHLPEHDDLDDDDENDEDDEPSAEEGDSPGRATASVNAAPLSGGAPLFMEGELLFDSTLTLVSRERATEEAERDHALALEAAGAGDCEGAWKSWRNAKRHVIRNAGWQEAREDGVRSAVASCWALSAERAEDRDAKVRLLRKAARFDFDNEDLLARARPLAATLMAEGLAARRDEDWEAAYRAFSSAVALDTRLSFARRYAEEARDHRLGIGEDGREIPKARKSKTPSSVKVKKASPTEEVEAGPEDDLPLEPLGGDGGDREKPGPGMGLGPRARVPTRMPREGDDVRP